MSLKAMMAGDVGDCVLAMCAFRALGGGTLCLHAENWTREKMNDVKVESLRSLLETQPYIDGVRWLEKGEQVQVNLNDFRAPYHKTFGRPDFPVKRNLCEWMLLTHGVDQEEQHKRWIVGLEPIRAAKVIINRTPRYQNKSFPWFNVMDKYGADIGFVGTKQEHHDFSRQFGKVQHVQTNSLLSLAQVIAGSDLFIGNQSCPYAIAEAMKKRAVLEVCRWLPNCLFNRPDCVHGWDSDVQFPDL